MDSVPAKTVVKTNACLLYTSGQLAANKVTATVMSNIGFHQYIIGKVGAEVDVTAVGDTSH